MWRCFAAYGSIALGLQERDLPGPPPTSEIGGAAAAAAASLSSPSLPHPPSFHWWVEGAEAAAAGAPVRGACQEVCQWVVGVPHPR